LPVSLVPSTVGVEVERVFGTRQVGFGFRVLRRQIPQDFDPLVFSELVFFGDDGRAERTSG